MPSVDDPQRNEPTQRVTTNSNRFFTQKLYRARSDDINLDMHLGFCDNSRCRRF